MDIKATEQATELVGKAGEAADRMGTAAHLATKAGVKSDQLSSAAGHLGDKAALGGAYANEIAAIQGTDAYGQIKGDLMDWFGAPVAGPIAWRLLFNVTVIGEGYAPSEHTQCAQRCCVGTVWGCSCLRG